MVVAFVLALVAAASFVWGGFLGSVTEDNGDTPWYLSGLIMIVAASALGAGSVALWKWSHGLRWPDRDPADPAIALFAAAFYGIPALVVLWIFLRVTGLMPPLISDGSGL